MSDVFAEVEEAMRRERLEKIWREYGKFIIAGIAAIVLGTGIVSGWRGWNDSVNAKQTGLLVAAMEAESPAAELQKIAPDLRAGLRGIALVTSAGILLADDKKDEALTVYEQAAGDAGLPAELQDMAVLARIAILTDKERAPENKEAQDKEFQKSLKKVWGNGSSPWRFHARLQAAALYAESGDFEKAAALLEPAIEEKQMAASLSTKIKALHHVYALEAAQQQAAAEAAEQAPAPEAVQEDKKEKNSEG